IARICPAPEEATESRLIPQARMVEPAAPWITRPAMIPPPVSDSAMKTHDATKSSRPARNTFLRPSTSPRAPEVTITAAPTSEYPTTAHWSCATGAPVSLLIVGSRIVTAEVLAFTTSAETEAASSTPRPALRSGLAVALTALVEDGDDQDPDERGGDPRDLQREREGVVDDALAERRRAGRVGLGGRDLCAVRGEEEHAGDRGPHRDHVAGADPERQAERDHGSRRGRLARRQRRDREDRHGDHEGPLPGEIAQRRDDRVLVARDEGVGHPRDAEERDHRHHPGPEDRHPRDV